MKHSSRLRIILDIRLRLSLNPRKFHLFAHRLAIDHDAGCFVDCEVQALFEGLHGGSPKCGDAPANRGGVVSACGACSAAASAGELQRAIR